MRRRGHLVSQDRAQLGVPPEALGVWRQVEQRGELVPVGNESVFVCNGHELKPFCRVFGLLPFSLLHLLLRKSSI